MQEVKFFHHLRACKVVEHPALTKQQLVYSSIDNTVYAGDAYSFLFLLTSATERKDSLDKGAQLCIALAKQKIARAIDDHAKMSELIYEAKRELGIQ